MRNDEYCQVFKETIICLQVMSSLGDYDNALRERHVCIFCPPKEAAGTRLYTHYYVLPTFNYYYRAAAPSRCSRDGEEERGAAAAYQ